ncbi:hypothetical protein ACP70R_003434 [Stipagrostis hirtigluma subsp. patula]
MTDPSRLRRPSSGSDGFGRPAVPGLRPPLRFLQEQCAVRSVWMHQPLLDA